VDPDQYGGSVYRFMDKIGWMAHAAPQDWMCEPFVIQRGNRGLVTFKGSPFYARHGLERPIRIHQELTIEKYHALLEHLPHAPEAGAPRADARKVRVARRPAPGRRSRPHRAGPGRPRLAEPAERDGRRRPHRPHPPRLRPAHPPRVRGEGGRPPPLRPPPPQG